MNDARKRKFERLHSIIRAAYLLMPDIEPSGKYKDLANELGMQQLMLDEMAHAKQRILLNERAEDVLAINTSDRSYDPDEINERYGL